MLLLDTCTLLWLASDQDRLSPAVKKLIQKNAAALFVSSFSALEIGIKIRNSKLELPLPLSEWFPAVLDHHGLSEITVDWSIAACSADLPLIHRDPFDRILIATALLKQLTLLTPDEVIKEYAQIKVVW